LTVQTALFLSLALFVRVCTTPVVKGYIGILSSQTIGVVFIPGTQLYAFLDNFRKGGFPGRWCERRDLLVETRALRPSQARSWGFGSQIRQCCILEYLGWFVIGEKTWPGAEKGGGGGG
jgi:hypothetical protein